MSYGYEYVLRYTVDSNFDDVTVYDVLTEYLYDRYGIDFEIKVCDPTIRLTWPG